MPSLQELNALREFFNSGATKTYSFRKKQLLALKSAIEKYEIELFEALHQDLKKSPEECWITENGFVLTELNYALKKLESWMKPHSVRTNLLNLPSGSYIMAEPLGVVLIIAPWNYPLNLLFTPLVGAIAAGNCMVMKASEFAPATAAVMKQIINETFDANYIVYDDGDGATVIPQLLDQFVFDHIFYTGSTAVGKKIYQQAAENLVPVTLELGGKSPCVVDEKANVKVAAKRIAMTKFNNAGQMCVAPDYVLVHASVKDEFLGHVKKALQQFFGDDASQSNSFGKIINEKQFDRLSGYIQNNKVIHGGRTDKSRLYIEPTLVDDVKMDSSIMTEEIFGPILPVLVFTDKEAALEIIEQNKNPLAFYVFTEDKDTEKWWLNNVAFGGGCVNNASLHLTNHRLPFGGRGNSGTGQYHGHFSFDTFSHKKAVLKTPTWLDPAIKYPPFNGRLKLFKWIIR